MSVLAHFKERRALSRSLDLAKIAEPQLRYMKVKARDTVCWISGIGAGFTAMASSFLSFYAVDLPASHAFPEGRIAIPGMDGLVTFGLWPTATILGGFWIYTHVKNIREKHYIGFYENEIEEIDELIQIRKDDELKLDFKQIQNDVHAELMLDAPSKPVAVR